MRTRFPPLSFVVFPEKDVCLSNPIKMEEEIKDINFLAIIEGQEAEKAMERIVSVKFHIHKYSRSNAKL